MLKRCCLIPGACGETGGEDLNPSFRERHEYLAEVVDKVRYERLLVEIRCEVEVLTMTGFTEGSWRHSVIWEEPVATEVLMGDMGAREILQLQTSDMRMAGAASLILLWLLGEVPNI